MRSINSGSTPIFYKEPVTELTLTLDNESIGKLILITSMLSLIANWLYAILRYLTLQPKLPEDEDE